MQYSDKQHTGNEVLKIPLNTMFDIVYLPEWYITISEL